MKLTKINKEQAQKIAKASLYVGVSAALSAAISSIASAPELFGVLTPLVNVALVTLKQAFTEPQ